MVFNVDSVASSDKPGKSYVFVYLVKQNNNTWQDTVKSLTLLLKNVISRFPRRSKIILFTEGDPPSDVLDRINALDQFYKISILFKQINLKSYVKRDELSIELPERFPNHSNPSCFFSLGYRDMCKFFSYDVFCDHLLDDFDYFVRIDTDSFFLHAEDKFIHDLAFIDSDYGYLYQTIQAEEKFAAVGFGHFLYEYAKHNNLINSGDLCMESLCFQATQNPRIFYTNFEVVKIDFIRNSSYPKFIHAINEAMGIYKFRWGDALIRYYALYMLKAKISTLKGALYKHSGIYDSRSFLRKYFTKFLLKMFKKHHSNNLESASGFIDRFTINPF